MSSFATSYIPTTSATVTRTADQASITGTNFSSWYNQSQGTMYSEVDRLVGCFGPNSPSYSLLGSSYTIMGITWFNDSTSSRKIDYYSYGINQGSQIYALSSISNFAKEIVSFNGVSASSCINAGTVQTNNLKLDLASANRLILGGYLFAFTLNGHIRKLSYYPQALSSAVLQSLTS